MLQASFFLSPYKHRVTATFRLEGGKAHCNSETEQLKQLPPLGREDKSRNKLTSVNKQSLLNIRMESTRLFLHETRK